ncbi:MAG: hypothetical protein NTY33_04860 [Candidatus Moranbacteria bacterium]|nr:hypothetical protein [Candidatus Moranbacteria bacterium]
MKICVVETPLNATDTLKFICIGDGRIVDLKSFRKICPTDEKERDEHFTFLRALDFLVRYPQSGKVGICARAYPRLALLTVGFTDHMGQWDPLVSFSFQELIRKTDDQILEEIRAVVGAA